MNLKQIRQAYEKLSWVFDSKSTNYAETILREAMEEERGHRKSGPEFGRYHPGAASVKDCARLFAVRRVAEALTMERVRWPQGADFLHVQRSWLTAVGVADEFGAEIRKAWVEFDLQALAKLDYCDFVKVQTPKEAVTA